MVIEHSKLLKHFVMSWFETRVDGRVKYETFLDFLRYEWYTCKVGEDSNVLFRGTLNSRFSEDEMLNEVKPLIESAIRNRRI